MPPSFGGPGGTFPTIASGQLVPNTAAADGISEHPQVSVRWQQAWPPFVYDFGPGVNYAQQSGIPTIQPPTIVAGALRHMCRQ